MAFKPIKKAKAEASLNSTTEETEVIITLSTTIKPSTWLINSGASRYIYTYKE